MRILPVTCLCGIKNSECDFVIPMYSELSWTKQKDRLLSSATAETRAIASGYIHRSSVSMAVLGKRCVANKPTYFEAFLLAAICYALPVMRVLTAT